MRKVEITEAEAPWAEYVQDREPIVLIRDGQPVAALVPIEGIDLETLMVRRLKPLGLKFRAYSAAQLYCPSSTAPSYCPSGSYAPMNRNPDQSRRRIEIRFVPPASEK